MAYFSRASFLVALSILLASTHSPHVAGQLLSKQQRKTAKNIIQGAGNALRGAAETVATVRAIRRQSLTGGAPLPPPVQAAQPVIPPQGLVKLPNQPIQPPLPPIQPQQAFPQQPLPGQLPLQPPLQGPQFGQNQFQQGNQQFGAGGFQNGQFNPQQAGQFNPQQAGQFNPQQAGQFNPQQAGQFNPQQNPVTLSQQLGPPVRNPGPAPFATGAPPVSVPFQGGSGPQACSATDSSPQAVERCINAVRTNPNSFAGLFPCGVSGLVPRKALLTDNRLTNAASNHARDMANMGKVGHTGSDGSDVSARVYRTGYPRGAVGENAAGGQNSAREVVFDWVCSEGHRKNLMSCDFDSMGTGVLPTGGWTYWVQNFGCKSGRCTC
ncbi:hypothetical protein BSKO_11276 [Bryopsis sp. KO-2023]|nr:hypothetical protein BSKO_11276 [Bryopsis sp. KO-2023]